MRVDHPGLAGGVDVEGAVEGLEVGRWNGAIGLDEDEGTVG